ncbi:exosome complex exonuclease RRP40 [Hysterangium stoloniferum]|nr:exosome complex exonuclease RRP40 [Hysterangium stoloniferum]
MALVLPGDSIPVASSSTLKLGPGLLQVSSGSSRQIITTRVGLLQQTANGANFWVESNSWRYVPAAQEGVIGVVTARTGGGETYRVDIGSAHPAQLDGLAFEGATKRNRPILKVGSLVYARVSLAHKDMEPELECFDAQTRKSEGFGELKNGFMVKCSLGMCRLLLDSRHFLLPMLGSRFPLEAAVGTNGRVWVHAADAKQVIAIARCIEAADPDASGMDESQIQAFLQEMDI